MSNYPPGVTGFEYEIGGPDSEQDEEAWCDYCGELTQGVVQGSAGNYWFICGVCNEESDVEPDWDAIRDARDTR